MYIYEFCVQLEDILEGKEHKAFTEFLAEENLTQELMIFSKMIVIFVVKIFLRLSKSYTQKK